jgi:hypothetical protein
MLQSVLSHVANQRIHD